MTVEEVLEEIVSLENESGKRVLARHGAKEPFYGVRVEDLKKIAKRAKGDQALALKLYETGVSDAMYLAGLLVDPLQLTRDDLNRWLQGANWQMLRECTVAWNAAENPSGWEIANEWILSEDDGTASAGWSTLSSLVSIKPDTELDLAALKALLERVKQEIHTKPNRTRYTMNGFVIAVGSYVSALTEDAL